MFVVHFPYVASWNSPLWYIQVDSEKNKENFKEKVIYLSEKIVFEDTYLNYKVWVWLEP